MSLADERLRALTRKQEILRTSLESWLDQTADTTTRRDPAFQIHYVQTREVDRLMTGLRSLIATALTRASETGAVIQRGATLEAAMLAGCQVWEFFREKLSQRLDAGLRPFLRVGDELAWQCYKPIRDLALGADNALCKAPPLVYLNSAWSPFTVPRNREYEVAAVPAAFLKNADFRTAMSRLPFPVIAVPWYQTTWLPDAVAICHEVGHSVEADFDLGGQIAGCIRNATDDPGAAGPWLLRASELFADFHGCLSVGPAFAWALANILLPDPAAVDLTLDASYPSIRARMAFNAAVLERMGFGAEMQTFRAAWTDAYPASADPAAVAADETMAGAIAHAFVGGERDGDGLALGGRRLSAAFGFTRAQQDEADADVEELVAGGEAASAEIRVLVAAAVLASRHAAFTAHERLLRTLRAACVDERRNEEALLPARTSGERGAHLEDIGAAVATDLLGDI